MEKVRISGHVVYLNMEGGFWGILADDGRKYFPVNLPNQLKKEGARIKIKAKILRDYVSSHMWGDPIEVISFETLT